MDCKTCILSWHNEIQWDTSNHTSHRLVFRSGTSNSDTWQNEHMLKDFGKRSNTQKSNAQQVARKNLVQFSFRAPWLSAKHLQKWNSFFPQQFRSLTCQLHTQQTFNTLLIPSNLQSETNCYHLTGVIIFPTHTMHYQRGKIPQNHHTFALSDPQKLVTSWPLCYTHLVTWWSREDFSSSSSFGPASCLGKSSDGQAKRP